MTSEDKDTWCEWAYAINEQTGKMFVYAFRYEQRRWQYAGLVDLRGPAPEDWGAFARAIWPEEGDEE